MASSAGSGRMKELSEIHQEEVRRMLSKFQAQRQEISLSLPPAFAAAAAAARSPPAPPHAKQPTAHAEPSRPACPPPPSSSDQREDFASMRRERDRLSQETALLKAELRGLWDERGERGGEGAERRAVHEDPGAGTAEAAEKSVSAGAGDRSLAEYLTSTQREGSPNPATGAAVRGAGAGELQEIADIAQLLRTEREIADYAKGSEQELDAARQEVQAHKGAVSLLQRQLQARHIEIEARLRDVEQREQAQQERNKRADVQQTTAKQEVDLQAKQLEEREAQVLGRASGGWGAAGSVRGV